MVCQTLNNGRSEPRCPLCGEAAVALYHRDAVREYHRCPACRLVFVPKQFHISVEREKKEYDLHENSVFDDGYLRFLSRFSTPLLQRLDTRQRGLDFGCGPAPALAKLLEQHGHSVALYDLLYDEDKSVLKTKYNFICATEVVEHFRYPEKEFAQFFTMLLPEGLLGIMTKMVMGKAAFSRWHYIRDPTHIAFYSKETFLYLGKKYGAEIFFVEDDVIFMQKNA